MKAVERIEYKSPYLKGFKALKKQHKLRELQILKEVIDKLKTYSITTQYNNHQLSGGNLNGIWELHITRNVLLHYRYEDDKLLLILIDLTDHDSQSNTQHQKNVKKALNSSLNESTANSNGVYSLFNGWLKKPVKDDIPDNVDLEPELSEWVTRSNECDSIESIDSFMDDIYKLRQESILKDGEYGKGNLIFKELRNRSILQALKDKKVELENQEMSLESYDGGIESMPSKVFSEEEQQISEANAKLKERYDRTIDWYHRVMEKQSLPGEYDRNHPTINEDLIARASNKFGFGSDKLRRALKGEDI